jgi:TolA-binding protein
LLYQFLITVCSNTLSFSGFASRALSTLKYSVNGSSRLAQEKLVEWVRKRIAELEEELSKMREILSVLENQQATVQSAETITEEDLAALPWRGYQSGKGEWVFADQAPKAQVERLEREGQVELGGYVYTLRETPSGRAAWGRSSFRGGLLRR